MLQHKSHVEKRPASGRGPDGFRAVLVAVDLSEQAERVVSRLTLLPLAPDCRVTLLHVVAKRVGPRDDHGRQEGALRALHEHARTLEARLPELASVERMVKVGVAASEIAATAEAMRADLVVVGRGSPGVLRGAFLGSTAERVVRSARQAVLVVRLLASAPYRRPALAIDDDQAAHEAVALLLRAIPPPRPIVSVIHAQELPAQGPIYPSFSAEQEHAQQEERQQQISRGLASLLRSAVARANVAQDDAPWWLTHVRQGPAREVIKQDVKTWDADLLVLGTHGQGSAKQVFVSSVAADVLRDVACDVLVAPLRREDVGMTTQLLHRGR